MRRKTLVVILAILSFGKIQGQTVVYTYDAAGGCTSRAFAEPQARAKSRTPAGYDTDGQSFKVDIAPAPSINGDITFAASFLDGKQDIPYVLSNVSGQVFSEGLLTNGNNTIHVPDLPQGIYILKVGEGDNVETYKLVRR